MKKVLIKQFTEENYPMEQLIKLVEENIKKSKKEGLIVEFITQKPVYNENGDIVDIKTDFPVELNIYKIINENARY